MPIILALEAGAREHEFEVWAVKNLKVTLRCIRACREREVMSKTERTRRRKNEEENRKPSPNPEGWGAHTSFQSSSYSVEQASLGLRSAYSTAAYT